MLETRLTEKLNHLYKILNSYIELNKKTKGRYNWRQQSIEAQIDSLEQLRDNKPDNWDLCLSEDKKEAGV